MKRKILFLFTFLIMVSSSIILADDVEEEIFKNDELQEIIETSGKVTTGPEIYSRAVAVIERNTGMVLYEKNMDQERPMASTTKIMTAIVVLENGNLKDLVEVSKKAAMTGGSRLGLKTGDKITVEDLLYGVMLKSRK